MINLLTKTVTLTLKDLVIGVSAVAGMSMAVTGGFMFSRSRNKVKAAVMKAERKLIDKQNELSKINNKNCDELAKFKSCYGDLLKKEYLKDITPTDNFISLVNRYKMEDELKIVLITEYTRMYNSIVKESNLYIAEHKSTFDTYHEALVKYNNVVCSNDEKNTILFAKMVIKELKERAAAKAKADLEAEKRREKEHELALKREENKKYEDYLEHLETIKKMEIDSQNLKTTAFAGVAKTAIDNFGKKKDEE